MNHKSNDTTHTAELKATKKSKAGTTTVAEQSLIIHYKATEPEEARSRLITALAASIRWKSAYTDDYKGDDSNMQTISQLIEVLTNVSPWS